jgi:hypothetical protein
MPSAICAGHSPATSRDGVLVSYRMPGSRQTQTKSPHRNAHGPRRVTEGGNFSLYYCFMNLVKVLCLTRGTQATFDQAQHGLSEQLRGPNNRELVDAYLRAFPSPNAQGRIQNFSEFMSALLGQGLSAQQDYDVQTLLPQILPGHRLWTAAANKKERFVAIHDIRTLVDKTNRQLWLNLYFVSDDLTRIGATIARFLAESGLSTDYVQVACTEQDNSGRSLICFQQSVPHQTPGTKYGNALQPLFDSLRPSLWATVSAVPPYRRHYVYLCPSVEQPQRLPQLLSIYALTYYFGSITRYRPHHFPLISDGAFGPRVQDFVTGQPQQFIYLMASEISQREITKPSIL